MTKKNLIFSLFIFLIFTASWILSSLVILPVYFEPFITSPLLFVTAPSGLLFHLVCVPDTLPYNYVCLGGMNIDDFAIVGSVLFAIIFSLLFPVVMEKFSRSRNRRET